jgi:hypothetical protein
LGSNNDRESGIASENREKPSRILHNGRIE